ncbi:MAG: tRNA uridine-5-carboxymethylaminomethyl(34) synthesis GTPase MnmE [Pirellula sp.]
MRLDTESTICSIATGSDGAYRGAIRVTGPNALAIVASAMAQPNQMSHRSEWQSPRAIRFDATIDLDRIGAMDVGVYIWPDGRSYTGQPSVEIHTLGNVVILQSIQAKLIEHGAQLAQPGEFTLRAFLAGRMDLTQCEAVLGVIHAANDRSLNVALSQLAGGLSQPLSELRLSLVNLLADIEAGLDFVDEDIAFISSSQIQQRLADGIRLVSAMLNQMESRSAQSVELKVVVAGPPNAGKSSLVNAMSQQEVSIVSHEPGTTRDYVRHRLQLCGMAVDLLDTAGIEELDSESPRGLAQQFTTQQITQADLILYCLAEDDSETVEPEFVEVDRSCCSVWLIRTKNDLSSVKRTLLGSYDREFAISLYDPKSLEYLIHAVQWWATERRGQDNLVVPATAARCHTSLSNALVAMSHAKSASSEGIGDEIVASEIRLALDEIGLVAGTVYTDDILDALFGRFCIGK